MRTSFPSWSRSAKSGAFVWGGMTAPSKAGPEEASADGLRLGFAATSEIAISAASASATAAQRSARVVVLSLMVFTGAAKATGRIWGLDPMVSRSGDTDNPRGRQEPAPDF